MNAVAPSHQASTQKGFSLIEIAVVLIIAGLALGAGLAALGPQIQIRRYSETDKQLQEASELIMAFAMVNRRLPCPATAASSGRESFCTNAAGACGAEQFVAPFAGVGRDRGRCAANPNTGFLPAATLGLGGQRADGSVVDAWAQPIRYVVPDTVNTTNNNAATAILVPLLVAMVVVVVIHSGAARPAYRVAHPSTNGTRAAMSRRRRASMRSRISRKRGMLRSRYHKKRHSRRP